MKIGEHFLVYEHGGRLFAEEKKAFSPWKTKSGFDLNPHKKMKRNRSACSFCPFWCTVELNLLEHAWLHANWFEHRWALSIYSLQIQFHFMKSIYNSQLDSLSQLLGGTLWIFIGFSISNAFLMSYELCSLSNSDFYLDQSTSQISMFLKWNLIISHKIWVLISILSRSIEIKNITNLGANDFSLWCDTLYSKTNCTHINRSTWHYIKDNLH